MTERDVADAIEICKNDFDGVVSDAPSGLTPARSDSGLRSQVSSRSTRSPEADDEASRGMRQQDSRVNAVSPSKSG
jgi:hypothetical protein